MLHDTVRTGPPIRLPPRNLKGESTNWVGAKLEKEVRRGQLKRRYGQWGGPPFHAQPGGDRQKSRRRWLVVDWRVNSRTLRATYVVRRASDFVGDAAGAARHTFLDAVAGFNHIRNTQRAREKCWL